MRMPIRRIPHLTLVGMLALLAAGCAATPEPPFQTAGLQAEDVAGFEHFYRRPDFSPGSYQSIRVEPVSIAFARNWKPMDAVTDRPLVASERELLRTDMAERFDRRFLAVGTGAEPGARQGRPGTLVVVPRLVDFSLYEPPRTTTATSRVPMHEPGSATLLVEVIDGETGTVVARAADTRHSHTSRGIFGFVDGGNWAEEAEGFFSLWAHNLRQRLHPAP